MLSYINKRVRHFIYSIFTRFNRLVERRANAFWYNYPIDKHQSGSREEFLRLANEVRMNKYPQIDEYEMQTDFAIDQDWLHCWEKTPN